MALSKAQTVSVCQFCDESPDIKWKCLTCDLFLCQICNARIHSKNETLAAHKIINLKECGTEIAIQIIRQVNLQSLQCSAHDHQKCCVFCKDCDLPICSQCLIKSHKGHDFCDLQEIYQAKVADITNLKTKLESDLPFFQTREDNLGKLLSEGESQFKGNKDKILQQEKAIKETVTKYAQELLQELETQWNPLEDLIKKDLNETKKNKEEMKTRIDTLEQALLSHQASDIFTTSHSMDKALPNKTDQPINLEKTKFIPGNIESHSRSKLFGDMHKVPEIKLVTSYPTEHKTIGEFILCENNTAVISCFASEKLQKVKFDQELMTVENEVKVAVYDMTMMPNGDILISAGRCDLKLCSQGQVKDFKSFKPLYTLGIHINKYNDILVGLTHSTEVSIPTQESVRKVVVLNQNCDLLHTYEFDTQNQRLFTWPRRIITCDDKIYVVDRIRNKSEGRVVAINQGGQLQWTYNGCDSVNSDKGTFDPRDMTITSAGLLLITDCNNHALHVLTNTGEIIVVTTVKDLGIEYPLCLNIDKQGILWVGCRIEDKNKNLHYLKLT